MTRSTRLPVKMDKGGRQAEAYCTPTADKQPQTVCIPPRRVIPIVFIPGIMGSNLRMNAERQAFLKKKNNIAWRPEDKAASAALMIAEPAERQLQLDPEATEVDSYDPVNNPTGDKEETSDERNSNVKVGIALNVGIDTPLLMDDPPTYKNPRTKDQKARERGWGEIFFTSYRQLLEMCELRLNTAFYGGRMDPWWKQVVGVSPRAWQAHDQPPLAPLTEDELKKAVHNCLFPVHAMGYNWLQSNKESGKKTATRVSALIEQYQKRGFICEKVIVVTHSMGGLVARAMIHPEMGNIHDKILGIVHGVMPAMGAAATYKRMRCGFESHDAKSYLASLVLGDSGDEVTAVLANAPGGLELLPSQAYGNHWLQIRHQGRIVKNLPQRGDPYEEIYKTQGKWYGLFRSTWTNPAEAKDALPERFNRYLELARNFHNAVANTYHEISYCHYGADTAHPAWHRVVWAIEDEARISSVDALKIREDGMKGNLSLFDTEGKIRASSRGIAARLLPASDPGDQTVPLHSAEHQLSSGKFKGVFRQTGYEHQASYQDPKVLFSTIFSIASIAKTMNWSK